MALHYGDGGYSLSNLFGADGQNVQVDSSPFCRVQERKLLQDVDNFSESRQIALTDKWMHENLHVAHQNFHTKSHTAGSQHPVDTNALTEVYQAETTNARWKWTTG